MSCRYVIVILWLVATNAIAGNVFKCQNAKGKPIFTDNIRHCKQAGAVNERSMAEVAVTPTNVHSQYGRSVSEEYFNYSFRAYEKLTGYRIHIIAEKALIDHQPALVAKAAQKLEKTILAAKARFPVHVSKTFSGVRFYIFSGDEARTGGRKGGQWYFRKGNNTSARFDDSIVVRSAKDYLRYSDKYALQVAVHELSHAYYHYNGHRIYRAIRDVFLQAKKNRLYLNVELSNGYRLKQAYALTNQHEYFAELAKIYHVGNYYYPYNAADLKQYDPAGYAAIRRAFLYGL